MKISLEPTDRSCARTVAPASPGFLRITSCLSSVVDDGLLISPRIVALSISIVVATTGLTSAQPAIAKATRLAGIGSFLHRDGDKDDADEHDKDQDKDHDKDRDKDNKDYNTSNDSRPIHAPTLAPAQSTPPALRPEQSVPKPEQLAPFTLTPSSDVVAPPAPRLQLSPPTQSALPHESPIGTQDTTIPALGAEPSQVIIPAQSVPVAGFDMPSYLPDNALISVLKDIARTLKEPAEMEKITDLNQRAVLRAARQVLTKAVEQPDLSADRFVHDRQKSVATMSTEAWASGEVKVSDQSRGSLAAVWAKHENGLINITIAGNSNDKVAPNGRKIGEYVVVISAKSRIEKGFDIQTQNEVDFWIGKLTSISIECDEQAIAASPNGPQPSADDSRAPVLQAVVTQRGRQYLVDAATAGHGSNTTSGAAGTKPAKSSPASSTPQVVQPKKPVPAKIVNVVPPADLIKVPSAHATVVAPDRVIAGQLMTASVVSSSGVVEPYVALHFNGATVYTDKKGQASYAVPDDSVAGRTLGVSFVERPEYAGATVEVIQPLSVPSQQQAPKMDRIALFSSNRFAVIDGHNFDGSAALNRVIVDGQFDAKVLSASPVQIKVSLPPSVRSGSHTLIVTVSNLRSAPVAFKTGLSASGRTAARQ